MSTPEFSTTYHITVRTVKTGMNETWGGVLGFRTVRWWNLTENLRRSPRSVIFLTARRGVNVVATGALGTVVVAGGVGSTLGEYQV